MLLVLLGDVLLLQPRAVLVEHVEAHRRRALGRRIELDRDRHQAEGEGQRCDRAGSHRSSSKSRVRPAPCREADAATYGQALCLVTGARPLRLRRRLEAEGLHARGQRLARRPVVRPGVALLEAQVFARGGDRPLRAALERHELVPGDRHRDAEPRPRARRERRRRRLPVAVAQVVDEDPADAVAAAALGDEALAGSSSPDAARPPARTP